MIGAVGQPIGYAIWRLWQRNCNFNAAFEAKAAASPLGDSCWQLQRLMSLLSLRLGPAGLWWKHRSPHMYSNLKSKVANYKLRWISTGWLHYSHSHSHSCSYSYLRLYSLYSAHVAHVQWGCLLLRGGCHVWHGCGYVSAKRISCALPLLPCWVGVCMRVCVCRVYECAFAFTSATSSSWWSARAQNSNWQLRVATGFCIYFKCCKYLKRDYPQANRRPGLVLGPVLGLVLPTSLPSLCPPLSSTLWP